MRSSASCRLLLALTVPAWAAAALAACSSSSASDRPEAGASGGDSGPGSSVDGSSDGASADATSDTGASDGGAPPSSDGSLPFACTAPPSPNPCPAPSGADGQASFCYRPGWAGVTKVQVYVGATGQASDWSAPFATLTNDGSGTFTGSAALGNGSYPYVFRVYGSSDGLVTDGTYLRDPENPNFQATVTGGPPRSLSVITVPQSKTAFSTYQVTGEVIYQGAAQPCYSVDLEVGELRADGGALISEHGTGAYTETRADGTYAFTVASGPIQVIVRYPFGLAKSYPDPTSTPSLGITRTSTVVAGADLPVPTVDVAYPLADYAAMKPVADASSALPVTFQFTIIPGSTLAQVSVTSTDIAGNDPAFASGYTTSTSVTWDGAFGSAGDSGAAANTTYYWGTWQEASAQAPWVGESLLFPITIQ